MGNRKKLLRILSAVALTVASMGGLAMPSSAQTVPVAGATHAGIVRGPANGAPVTLTWTLRSQDLFACESAAYDLRALVRSYGGAISLRVIAIDSDPALVAAFMRREQINAAVVHLSTREYRRAHRTNPIPGIDVSRQGQLIGSVNAGLVHVRGRRNSDSLDEIVREILAPSRLSFVH